MCCCRGVKERVQAQTSRFHGVRLNKRTKKWEVRTKLPSTLPFTCCHPDCNPTHTSLLQTSRASF